MPNLMVDRLDFGRGTGDILNLMLIKRSILRIIYFLVKFLWNDRFQPHNVIMRLVERLEQPHRCCAMVYLFLFVKFIHWSHEIVWRSEIFEECTHISKSLTYFEKCHSLRNETMDSGKPRQVHEKMWCFGNWLAHLWMAGQFRDVFAYLWSGEGYI
jgi:hypothetical protein